MSANFNDDIAFEKKHKPMVVKLFLIPGTILTEERALQKRGIDAISPSKSTSEIKVVRWKGKEYKALTLETHSKLSNSPRDEWDTGMGDGWMFYSEADYLDYVMLQEDGSYLGRKYEMQPLRQWFGLNYHRYTIWDTPNECNGASWTTRCRIVPLEDISKFLLCEKTESQYEKAPSL